MTWTLSEIADQLRSCEFECEAGMLTNNVAFVALEQMAAQEAEPAVNFLGSTDGPDDDTARYLETLQSCSETMGLE